MSLTVPETGRITLPNLFDHELGSHISLDINGDDLKGYEHGTESHYSGKISGTTVTVFDHGTGGHYHYTV